jgi:uncharacterized membrane protein YkvA (DUF1232 family)
VITARERWAFDAQRTPAAALQPVEARGRFLNRLKRSARLLRRNLVVLWLAARDRRVPWYAKAIAGVAGAYPVWPIDFIPDAVPVLGYIDDVVIVSLGVFLATRLIPAAVMADLWAQTGQV